MGEEEEEEILGRGGTFLGAVLSFPKTKETTYGILFESDTLIPARVGIGSDLAVEQSSEWELCLPLVVPTDSVVITDDLNRGFPLLDRGLHFHGGVHKEEGEASSHELAGLSGHAFTSSKRIRAPSSFPTVIAGTGNNQFHMSQPPDSISYNMPSCGPHSSPWRSLVPLLTPFSGHQGTPASGRASWNRSGGICGFPTNSPISVLSAPHFGPWGSPNSIAESSGTPQSISVGGSSLQISSGSSLKPASCGRGRSSNDKASVQRKPKRYYCKSMLEHPWRNLEPIVGNILEPMAGPGYWLPESISGKKCKVSETQSSNQLNSKWSLAELPFAVRQLMLNLTEIVASNSSLLSKRWYDSRRVRLKQYEWIMELQFFACFEGHRIGTYVSDVDVIHVHPIVKLGDVD
ncbi:hypothetical protein OPV22_008283 [Ensete ventricosum]|uniref:Uncharacterized protein n=1 Tax=Ensete ventricosum TaxID=4639 RepID=A0AAV8R696_ENSVE|nr:hypothetical protein OPV22_008283 [Ensete ventricosum]